MWLLSLHGLFTRYSLTWQVIIRQCCIIYSVCATRLLGLCTRHCLVRLRFSNGISAHGISQRLATPIEPRGNTSQQPLSKDQQDFSSRESTLDFSSGFFQLAFLNGDFIRLLSYDASHPRTLFTGFLILIIMFNVRLFSTAHHSCGITITGPPHKRRRLIQRYVREGKYSIACGHFIHKCTDIMNA